MQGRHNIAISAIDVFSSPPPKKTWPEFFSTCAYWLFPLTLIWGATKIVANKFFGPGLTKKLFPAYLDFTLKATATELRETFVNSIQGTRCHLDRYKVKTHDNALLDTFELNWAEHSDDDDSVSSLEAEETRCPVSSEKERIHIINFLDNKHSSEQILEQMEDDVVELGANVIAFNYRGVGLSTGKLHSKDDLLTDGIAQVQRLIQRGIDPEKIVLKGHGFGAGIATLVAKHCHDKGSRVNLFSSRSFSNVTNYLVGQMRSDGRTGHHETWHGKIWGWLARPFLKLKLCASNWEMEVATAYSALPDTHKEYMVVRSRKSIRTLMRKDDPIVTHYASLHASLKPQRQQIKQHINQAKQNIQAAAVGAALSREYLQQSLEAVVQAKRSLRDRKMEPESDSINGHTVDADELNCRHSNINASHFFQQFTERVMNHHAKNPAAARSRLTVH